MGTIHYISTSGESGSGTSSADNRTLAFAVNPEKPTTIEERFGATTTPENYDQDDSSAQRPIRKINYGITYDKVDTNLSMDQIMIKLNRTVGIVDSSLLEYETMYATYQSSLYNRFKLPVANDKLMRGFGHVFFVRPNCNILSSGELTRSVKNNPIFAHIYKNSPNSVKELVLNNGSDDDFAYSLSNAATNFPLSDEFIEADNYGKTWTGYKVAFGRHNIDSKTAGDVQINFRDDRNLHIYKTHKLWVEYISGCYRGEIAPRDDDIINKILDYAGAIYYIMTAEDGETILFWTKYYGVFPVTIPSDPFTWAETNTIQNPELPITYKYSFKEDYNPLALSEFNRNARISGSTKYAPVYDSTLGHSGDTWVGTPFIDSIQLGDQMVYKLRFKRADDNASGTKMNYWRETSTTTYNKSLPATNETNSTKSSSSAAEQKKLQEESILREKELEAMQRNRVSDEMARMRANLNVLKVQETIKKTRKKKGKKK